jgi:hypothetical protein
MAELSQGILPREYHDETELTPQDRRIWEANQNGQTQKSGGRNAYRGGERSDEPLLYGQAQEVTRTTWPTPNASVANDGEGPETWRKRQALLKEKGYNGNGAGVPLSIVAQESQEAQANWPTANTKEAASAGRHTTTTGRMHPGTTLTDAIRLWPTSRAEDAESAGNHPGAQDSLTGMTKDWATPAARDYRMPNSEDSQERRKGNETRGQQLPNQVRHQWMTPRQSDFRSGEASEEVAHRNSRPLTEQVTRSMTGGFLPGHPDPTTEAAGLPSSLGGRILRPQLSALFVEWLMGMPLGWTCVCAVVPTDFVAWATRPFPLKRKPRYASYGGGRSVSPSREPWFKQAGSIFGSRT